MSPDDPLSYCKAGGLAWFAGSFFESPIDLFKSQSQQQILRAKADPSFVPQSMASSVKDCREIHGSKRSVVWDGGDVGEKFTRGFGIFWGV